MRSNEEVIMAGEKTAVTECFGLEPPINRVRFSMLGTVQRSQSPTPSSLTIATSSSSAVERSAEHQRGGLGLLGAVTRKCDSNDYLIRVECSSLKQSQSPKQQLRTQHHQYTPFEELLRCGERERAVRQWCCRLAVPLPRMRLVGGGEDSINNGTSAWGTPPAATNNGSVSAWGVLPNQQQQQQQQQQQSMPPSAWGNANSNNNNNPTQPPLQQQQQQQQQQHHRQMNSSTSSTIDTVNSNGGTTGGAPKGNASSSNVTPNAWNNASAATQNHHRGAHQQANAHHPNNNNNMVNNNGAGGGTGGQQHQQQQQNAGNNGANGGGTAKNPQLEQLNTMREALFAQDGWGCEHVNQDTNWEVPGSPEPTPPATGGASAGGGGLAGASANPMGGGSASNVPKPSDGRSAPNGGGGGGGGGAGAGWKVSNMNTGTELWESNLRNGAGGAGPHNHHHHGLHHQQPKVATAPWVPTNNLGGTWMEDDDTGGPTGAVAVPDPATTAGWNGSGAIGSTVPGATVTSASAWAGSNAAGGGWQAGAGPVGGGQQPQQTPATIGGGLKKDLNEWNAAGGAAAAAAAGLMLGGGGVASAGGVVPGPSNVSGWNDGRTGVGGFNLATSVGQSVNVIAPSAGTGLGGLANGELRGDPRGISGRLNGGMVDSAASSIVGGMWGGTEHVPGGSMLANKLGGGSALVVNNAGQQPWGAAGTGGNGAGNKLAPSGWDDAVNGGRPVSLDEHGGVAAMGWGQGAGANSIPLARQNSAGGWKDPMGRPGQQAGGAAAPFARPIGGGPLAIGKAPDAMWGGGAGAGGGGGGGQNTPGIARNGSWEEPSNSNWSVGGETGDKGAGAGGGTPWNVELGAPGWNKPMAATGKIGGSVGWPDAGSSDLTTAGTMDWCLAGGGVKHGAGGVVGKQQPSLHNPIEFVRSSKEYRMLCEMGHKKEEVEFALRAANMNIDEAMDLLRHGVAAGAGGWRGAGAGVGGRSLIDDHHGAGFDGGPFAGGPPRIPPLNHAGGGLSYSQNNQAMLNNIAIGPGASLGSLDGATGGPANLVALNSFKYLSQGSAGGGLTGQHHPSFNQVGVVGVGGRGQQQQQQQQHHHHHHQQQQQQQQQQLAAAAAAQPSNQQLRMLVQQIQLAVQSGFLNHQILNQPLAPQTLILLNQLLNHIKQMQMTQSNLARSGTTGGVSAVQLTLAINKHKSQITQLQQQIAAQQSIYLKQQQQQQQQGQPGPIPPPSLLPTAAGMGVAGGGGPPGGMDFLRQQHDLMALQSNFGELALGKDALLTTAGTASVFTANAVPVSLALAGHAGGAGVSGAAGNVGSNGNSSSSSSSTSQQSRLNQWKLPSLEKDPSAGKDDLTDFSRAPGPASLAKSTITTPATTGSGNLDILGLVQDGWPAGLEQPRRTNLVTDGWPEQQADESDGKDWATGNGGTTPPDNSTFSDLVPEFEPGKPWKGTQMKIEDDPSITPGSVARSPLSIANAAKDSELFAAASSDAKAGGISPSSSSVALTDAGTISGGGGGGGLDLTSSAWSFSTAGTSPSTVVSTVIGTGTDVWSAPIGKLTATTRGPPPGLGGANGGKHGASTGGVASRISATATWGGTSGGAGTAGNWGAANGTSWLLLRNLTSQIDASTLRTLCMQHGPILSFHPYPAHGLALCRYTSRDEAMKAQQALNNCPLGASTISAECPTSEAEVQTYLQQLGGGTAITSTVSSSAGTASGTGSISSSISSQSWRLRTPAAATGGTDTWGSGWPIGRDAGDGSGSTNTSNLWAPLDGGDRETPSSLNSFLPESLLGSELN